MKNAEVLLEPVDILAFAIVSLFSMFYHNSSSPNELTVFFVSIQSLRHPVAPLQCTTLLGPLWSIRPLLRIQFLVLHLSHLQQKRERNCWSFFEKVSEKTKMMVLKTPQAMRRKKINQLCRTFFLSLHAVLLISQGLTLHLVVKEP